VSQSPIAFLSYARFDDEFERGRLTELRQRLSGEVRAQTGEPFNIFQDREHLNWGQSWSRVMDDLLDSVLLLIAVLSPSFFKSPACRGELERFLVRERRLGRDDLVFPVYYLDCEVLEDPAKRQGDPLAEELARRQLSDWRKLRFSDLASPEVGRQIAGMAAQIGRALRRAVPAKSPRAESPTSARLSGQRREPTTWVVDAFHRGDFPTVTEAVRAAAPGDKILIRRGLYRESIGVDKPLEIEGEGDRKEIVIEAGDGSTLEIHAPIAKVSNLTLRQLGGDEPCLRLEGGLITIEDCEIVSSLTTTVFVGTSAESQVRRNWIQGGVYLGGRAILEDNEIYGSRDAAVVVAIAANPILRRNRVRAAWGPGVKFEPFSEGDLEDNDIGGNRGDGVLVESSAAPKIISNKIHLNGGFGINVIGFLFGSAWGNELHQNTKGDLGGGVLNLPSFKLPFSPRRK
jgi:F-box protein 11